MNKGDIINNFISKYDYFLKYALKICGKIGRADKSEDIIHDIFLIISSDHFEKQIEHKVNTKEELEAYIKTIIQRASLKDQTEAWKRNHPLLLSLDSPHVRPEDIMRQPENEFTTTEDEIYKGKLDVFQTIFDQLNISEHNREIYIFHCVKGNKLKDWKGPETLKRLNKICYKINKAIKQKIKENKFIYTKGGVFFLNLPL